MVRGAQRGWSSRAERAGSLCLLLFTPTLALHSLAYPWSLEYVVLCVCCVVVFAVGLIACAPSVRSAAASLIAVFMLTVILGSTLDQRAEALRWCHGMKGARGESYASSWRRLCRAREDCGLCSLEPNRTVFVVGGTRLAVDLGSQCKFGDDFPMGRRECLVSGGAWRDSSQ